MTDKSDRDDAPRHGAADGQDAQGQGASQQVVFQGGAAPEANLSMVLGYLVSSKDQHLADLQRDKINLQAQLAAKETHLSELTAAHATRVSELTAEVTRLTGSAAQLAAKETHLSELTAAHATRVSELTAEVTRLTGSAAHAKGFVEGLLRTVALAPRDAGRAVQPCAVTNSSFWESMQPFVAEETISTPGPGEHEVRGLMEALEPWDEEKISTESDLQKLMAKILPRLALADYLVVDTSTKGSGARKPDFTAYAQFTGSQSVQATVLLVELEGPSTTLTDGSGSELGQLLDACVRVLFEQRWRQFMFGVLCNTKTIFILKVSRRADGLFDVGKKGPIDFHPSPNRSKVGEHSPPPRPESPGLVLLARLLRASPKQLGYDLPTGTGETSSLVPLYAGSSCVIYGEATGKDRGSTPPAELLPIIKAFKLMDNTFYEQELAALTRFYSDPDKFPHLPVLVDRPSDTNVKTFTETLDRMGIKWLAMKWAGDPVGFFRRLSFPLCSKAAPISAFCDFVAGLQAAHDLGYLHGDVRPGNLLVHPNTGRGVVVDWSHSKQVGYKDRGPPLHQFYAGEVGELYTRQHDLVSLVLVYLHVQVGCAIPPFTGDYSLARWTGMPGYVCELLEAAGETPEPNYTRMRKLWESRQPKVGDARNGA